MSSGWISVEDELPKVGKPVLVNFTLSTGVTRTTRAIWVKKFTCTEDEYGEFNNGAEYEEASDDYYWPEGWYEYPTQFEESMMISEEVTHWMPLPAAPMRKESR